jgi:hypothetical protein
MNVMMEIDQLQQELVKLDKTLTLCTTKRSKEQWLRAFRDLQWRILVVQAIVLDGVQMTIDIIGRKYLL